MFQRKPSWSWFWWMGPVLLILLFVSRIAAVTGATDESAADEEKVSALLETGKENAGSKGVTGESAADEEKIPALLEIGKENDDSKGLTDESTADEEKVPALLQTGKENDSSKEATSAQCDITHKEEKEEPPLPKARFVSKTVIIPHDARKFYGGQDAASNTDDLLVVTDASSVRSGLDPGGYARRLATTMTGEHYNLVQAGGQGDPTCLYRLAELSKRLATDALRTWDWEHLDTVGFALVNLRDACTIETLQQGDAGFSIHRRRFPTNSEGDLGPVGLLCASCVRGNVCDVPPGTVLSHNLKDKDVIVVVSGGVIDNWDPREFQNVCIGSMMWSAGIGNFDEKDLLDAKYGEGGYFEDGEIVSLSAVADCIARQVHFLSREERNMNRFLDRRYRGTLKKLPPYREGVPENYYDGTPDDITVTVAQIQQARRDPATGAEAFPAREDVWRPESVFVYRESDGPVDFQERNPPSMAEVVREVLDFPKEWWQERRERRRKERLEQRRQTEMEGAELEP